MNPQSLMPRSPNRSFLRRWTFLLVCTVALTCNNATKLAAQESAEQPAFLNPSTLKFAPVPGLPACFTAAVLRGDPGKGPSMLMLKFAAGCTVPWHWHTANEHLLVLKGTFRLETKEAETPLLQPGAYAFMPAHHVHQGGCASGCTLFDSIDGAFDIHYVDGAGKEISLDEALKGLKPAKGPKKKQ